MTKLFKETAGTGIAFRAGVRGQAYHDVEIPSAKINVQLDAPQGPIEQSFAHLNRLAGLSDPVASYETGRALRMVGFILDQQKSPAEFGARFQEDLADAVLSFALRDERQPWGAEDTAFIFLTGFCETAPDDVKDEVRASIVGYARKRPIVLGG